MSIVLQGGIVRPDDAIEIELPPLPHEPLIYRIPDMQVRVVAVVREAQDIHSLHLKALDGGDLPTFSAGSHIDLKLREGVVRSYSLSSDPARRDRYVVTVSKSMSGRGGSRYLHEQIRVGDHIPISPPKNNFRLREDAGRTVLVAGGMGITPLKAMIARLEAIGRDWRLFYAARTRDATAFIDHFEDLERAAPGRVRFYWDAEPGGQAMDVSLVVAAEPDGTDFYCCGPRSLMEAFKGATASLPQERVHVEYFAGTDIAQASPDFAIKLHRRGIEVMVRSGVSVLDALLAAGVPVPHSCKQGVCGSCRVKVLEGVPDHRDSFLSAQDHERNGEMLVCCSGSKSASLTLDL